MDFNTALLFKQMLSFRRLLPCTGENEPSLFLHDVVFVLTKGKGLFLISRYTDVHKRSDALLAIACVCSCTPTSLCVGLETRACKMACHLFVVLN